MFFAILFVFILMCYCAVIWTNISLQCKVSYRKSFIICILIYPSLSIWANTCQSSFISFVHPCSFIRFRVNIRLYIFTCFIPFHTFYRFGRMCAKTSCKVIHISTFPAFGMKRLPKYAAHSPNTPISIWVMEQIYSYMDGRQQKKDSIRCPFNN